MRSPMLANTRTDYRLPRASVMPVMCSPVVSASPLLNVTRGAMLVALTFSE